MVSRTKYNIDAHGVRALFQAAGMHDAAAIAPLGAGEFCAVFSARADGKDCVVKIAPPAGVPVLTYEQGMMAAEVFWCRQMREHTTVRVPEIYYADLEHTVIPAAYFIMEKLPGRQLDQMKLTDADKASANAAVVQMAAQMHRIKNNRFGYVQSGLHDTWYLAIASMVQNLLNDCAAKGKSSTRGVRLLQYIRQHQAVLEQAPCSMVNFDIWPPNILCTRADDGIRCAWIDHERSFWGDPIVDFVCFEMFTPLADKKASLAAYNAVADRPVTASREETIRYAVALGYLGLIMEVEKYYRYTTHHFGWWRNVFASGMLYRQAFSTLLRY